MSIRSYVSLDTNILVRLATQGIPGCEIEHWQELKSYVDKGLIRLIIPEIVLLEFEKALRAVLFKCEAESQEIEKLLKEQFKGKFKYNENANVKEGLLDSLSQARKKKTESAETIAKDIQSFLASNKVKVLECDVETILRGKKRLWAGRIANPNTEAKPEADCCIIESILMFLEKEKKKGVKLRNFLWCCENILDFGLTIKEGGQPKHVLHPLVRDGFPPSEIFLCLKDLVTFLKNQKEVKEPPEEDVQKALDAERMKSIEESGAFATSFVEIVAGAQHLQETMQPFQEIASRYAETMRPFQEITRRINETMQPFQEITRRINETMQPLQDVTRHVREAMHIYDTAGPLREISRQVNETMRIHGSLRHFQDIARQANEMMRPYLEFSRIASDAIRLGKTISDSEDLPQDEKNSPEQPSASEKMDDDKPSTPTE